MILSLFCTLIQDEPVFSGPQPGERLVPFVVTGVLGKDADQKIDVVTESDTKPCVLIFVHEPNRPAFGLSNMVMRLVQDRGPEKIAGSLIFLTDDPTETTEWMNRVPEYFPKLIRLGISVDGKEGPGAYGLNRNVALTVLIAKTNIVTASFALVQPSIEVDGPKIFKAIAELLGEQDVPKIADYQPKSRGEGAPMKREADPQHPEIRNMLSPVIQRTATDEEVVAAATKVEEFAAAHSDFRIQVGDIARRIIAAEKPGDYGTPKCQEYLSKWAKEFTPEAPEKSESNQE
ncbi:MAG: hypothetical protein WKF77_21335 [Planctomycetaceae bacterium]